MTGLEKVYNRIKCLYSERNALDSEIDALEHQLKAQCNHPTKYVREDLTGKWCSLCRQELEDYL